jgi:hypothetical protein
MITVLMRCQEHPNASGWVVRLKETHPHIKVGSRSERFGRLSHAVKTPTAGILLTQGVSSEVKTTFEDMSVEQHQILLALTEAGIIGKVTGLASETPTTA